MKVKDLINELKKYDNRFVYVWDDKIELWNNEFDIQEKTYRKHRSDQFIKRVVLIPSMSEYAIGEYKLSEDVINILNQFDENEEVVLAGRYFHVNGDYELLLNHYEEVDSSFKKSVRIH